MRRISSLPTAEFCPMVDKIGQDVESTQSARSTVFHAYCDTGKWPEEVKHLPEADREEIGQWRVPMPFVYAVGGITHALQYPNAYRETRVALDWNFAPVIVDKSIPQADIGAAHPEVMVVGHLDMAWVVGDLVIVCDIKSSIYAVKDRCDSLQLHAYGLALAVLLGRSRYLTAIWDAAAGRYYVSATAIELDSFECEDIKDRIRNAATEREGGFRTGTHCSGCWKRTNCPAHLVDVPEGEFRPILTGQATHKEVREAIVKLKQIKDLGKRVEQATKDWVALHGPVPSEDGKTQYRCEMRANRAGYDYEAIQKALGVSTLDDFKTRGSESPCYSWRKKD